jgi:hypothetical protein
MYKKSLGDDESMYLALRSMKGSFHRRHSFTSLAQAVTLSSLLIDLSGHGDLSSSVSDHKLRALLNRNRIAINEPRVRPPVSRKLDPIARTDNLRNSGVRDGSRTVREILTSSVMTDGRDGDEIGQIGVTMRALMLGWTIMPPALME